MDKEDHRRFMPPGYRDYQSKIKVIYAVCQYDFDVNAENRPLPGEITGIDLDFPPEEFGPLILIKCPNCKVNFIAPKKRWKLIASLVAKINR